jgi:hypothetical protein
MASDGALSFKPQRPSNAGNEPLLPVYPRILQLPRPQREQRRQIPAAIVLHLGGRGRSDTPLPAAQP